MKREYLGHPEGAAFGLKDGKQNPEEDGFISRKIASFKEDVRMVKKDRIRDSKTI